MEYLFGFMYLLLFAIAFVISYFVTAGVVWLVCQCFDWQFSWAIATGIWLLTLLIK